MKKVVDSPYHAVESDLLAFLLEGDLIAATDHWTRSPTTGQLEPFHRQPFYEAAKAFADDIRYIHHLEQLDQLRDLPDVEFDDASWADADAFHILLDASAEVGESLGQAGTNAANEG